MENSKFQNAMMKYLMPIANKLEQQKHLQAVKDGMILSVPIIIVGNICHSCSASTCWGYYRGWH